MKGIRQCADWLRTIRPPHGLVMSSNLLGDGFGLGITSRLVIAFIGVAALVVAANVIVEQGVLIERTTQITRTLPQPEVSPRNAMIAPEPLAQPVAVLAPAERPVLTSDALLLALDRFTEAVHERVGMNVEQSNARYQRAIAELDDAVRAFITTAASISGKTFGKIGAAVNSYRQHGEELVHKSDDRRELTSKYAALFEALTAGEKSSLTGSWKIFGRVITRQSLLQLSADLDTLLHLSVTFASADHSDPAQIAALLMSEQAIQKDLDENKNSLRHSQGDAWFNAMRTDIDSLVALRAAIDQTDKEMQERSQELSQQAVSLAKTIPRKIESPPSSVTAVKKQEILPSSTSRPQTASAATVPSNVANTPPLVEKSFLKTEPVSDHTRRVKIAWISAGVLILLLYIAIGTVLSIVRPVRRLLDATARLARGDANVEVSRGGIKELDTVAVAFNAMAAELSEARETARDYQQSLELKVVERTRQLQTLAERDPLTGLPNRRELFALLNAAIERAELGGEQIGIFFLDIDNFKYINDSMGHAFGDRVLISLAQRLQATTQAFGFAARLGGDEFTVVFDRAQSTEAIRVAGTSIVQAFQKPLAVDGRDLIVSVSVGASIYPEHEKDAEALLKAADAALFRAKALGRSQLSVFTPELLEAAAAKFTTEQGLRRAIERGEFELLFQPEVSVETLETTLVEALLRWRTPDGRLASPGDFLEVAEESGLIMQISDWVLQSAIEAAAHWHHGAWPEVRVAINVTPRQLIDVGFFDRLHDLLHLHRLPSRCIEIELTESVLQTGPATIEALKRLRAHGVAIALDDFGTGYSSLASLEQLPLSRIKLDRSLIAGIDNSPRSAAIAHAIIAMCQGLGLEITAEGIERPEQFAMLLKHRGMYLQGYLLAHPTSRDELLPTMANVAKKSQDLLLSSPRELACNVVGLPTPHLRVRSEAG
jgi:diguanylate cyclase (GGDEF)-like protein